MNPKPEEHDSHEAFNVYSTCTFFKNGKQKIFCVCTQHNFSACGPQSVNYFKGHREKQQGKHVLSTGCSLSVTKHGID